MASKGLLSILQGVADSGMNLLAQSGSAPTKGKKGSIAGNCLPCAAARQREAMNAKWRGKK
jgi:hypothetical protein